MSGYVAEFSGVTNSGGTTTTVTLSSDVPAGDSLVATIVTQNSAAPVMYITATDSRDNTWRFVRSTMITGTDTVVSMLYAYVVRPLTSGDTVVIRHQTSIDRSAVSVAQFNDALTADVGNEGDNGGSGSTTLVTAATATTTDANELIVGAFGLLSETRTFTATNSFTGLTKVLTSNGTSDRAICPEYKYVASTGTYTANGTLNLSSIYGGIVQTFKLSVPPDTRYGRPKTWSGSAWVEHDAKAWSGSAWNDYKVKGRKAGTWIGPLASNGETILYDSFDKVPLGSDATVGNTKFGLFGGSAPSTRIGVTGLHGTALSFAVSTSDFCNGIIYFPSSQTDMYLRTYFRVASYPPGNVSIMTIRNSSATALANLQISTTGRIRIRNGTTLVATTTNAIGTNTWVRLEWHYSGAGSQDFRLFLNSNVEGTTADETQTSLAAVSGIADRMTLGIVDATTSSTFDFDEFAIDGDKWVDSK
ncbi:TPA: hypothetical protein DIV49_01690 [Candidatus Saccharibacteria bacterium]|nr:hypothetical protein [Candidatus Saccharibacteria bacterium]HRJ91052.1 hypothetical protein [Candidatus Saccharibacteria bacterium]